VYCIYYCLSDVEAVICTLDSHLPIVHTTFLLCMPPFLCCHIGKPRHRGKCHGRISGVRAGVGMVARRIRYRAIYIQKSNPVVGSIDRT
jgi:hypothetical protein